MSAFEGLPTRRRDAIQAKVPYYFNGKPCPKGHLAKRSAQSGGCYECVLVRQRSPEGQAYHNNWLRNTEKGKACEARYKASDKRKAVIQKHTDSGNLSRNRLKRYHEDPYFKLTTLLRRRLKIAFKKQSAGRSLSTEAPTGCSTLDLKDYLLELAKTTAPGATLENFGEWQIDHIRAVGLFDLNDPLQAAACFHYTNLQPLWRKDHLEKTKRDIQLVKESRK